MKTIIAGTDFSASSFNACKYAAMLAMKLNCKLTLFNMFETPIVHSNVGLYGFTYTNVRRESQEQINKFAQKLIKLFPEIKIDQFVTSRGFKEELEDFIASHQVEAAVMGHSAKTRIARFLFGSHGASLAGHIKAPVIIIPESYKSHKIEKIVLAVDSGEKMHKSPLDEFEKFIKQSKTSLDLLHVKTEDELFPPVIDSLKINSKKLPIKVVKEKSLENGVKKYCKQNKIDLIGIISKKHSVFYNLFAETCTKRIIFTVKVPVMAIHE